jgi:hypothetical protein
MSALRLLAEPVLVFARRSALHTEGKQALEGSKVMAEYQAARAAETEKTNRLRAARLAREAEADVERANGQASTEKPREKSSKRS